MPPFVTTLRPRNLIPSPLEDKDMLNMRALLERRIDNGLGRDRLATTPPFVRSEDYATLAVINTVAKSLRRETGEDDRVDSTNAGTSQKCSDGLPSHGKVDRDRIAFVNTKAFEDIGQSRDLAQQFGEGDFGPIGGFIGLIDNRSLYSWHTKSRDVQHEGSIRPIREAPTLFGCLNAQRSTQL